MGHIPSSKSQLNFIKKNTHIQQQNFATRKKKFNFLFSIFIQLSGLGIKRNCLHSLSYCGLIRVKTTNVTFIQFIITQPQILHYQEPCMDFCFLDYDKLFWKRVLDLLITNMTF